MEILKLIGRNDALFKSDILDYKKELEEIVSKTNF